jgi:hypothetical protein
VVLCSALCAVSVVLYLAGAAQPVFAQTTTSEAPTTTEPPTTTTTPPASLDDVVSAQHDTRDVTELGLALIVFLLAVALPSRWIRRQ